MAEEKTTVVEFKEDFYRDSFSKVLLALIGAGIVIAGLVGLSIFLYLDKPPPITFPVDNDMHVQPPVPLDQPYLSNPELLQWLVDVFSRVFVLDFNHYNDQLKTYSQYFTSDGWQTFLNQLNIYANYTNVQAYKLFVTSAPSAAPYMIRPPGVMPDTGKFGWSVQMPLTINYAGYKPPPSKPLVLQVRVVRVSTLNNLMGVAIDNVIQAPPPTTGNQR